MNHAHTHQAANCMDIKTLLDIACAKTASFIKGKPIERMADILEGRCDAKGAK